MFFHWGNGMDYSQKSVIFHQRKRNGVYFGTAKRGRLGVGLLSVTAMTIAYFRVGTRSYWFGERPPFILSFLHTPTSIFAVDKIYR